MKIQRLYINLAMKYDKLLDECKEMRMQLINYQKIINKIHSVHGYSDIALSDIVHYEGEYNAYDEACRILRGEA